MLLAHILAPLVKTRSKTTLLLYFNLDWNVNIANSAKRTMKEHTFSALLLLTLTPSVCWASLLLNCCTLLVYGRISCCISVMSSPQQVYRRRAADVNPSLTVHWSKSCSKKKKDEILLTNEWIRQSQINTLRGLQLRRGANARNVSLFSDIPWSSLLADMLLSRSQSRYVHFLSVIDCFFFIRRYLVRMLGPEMSKILRIC